MLITLPHLKLRVSVSGVSNYVYRRANTCCREGIYLFVGGEVNKMHTFLFIFGATAPSGSGFLHSRGF